jgi:spore coat polysaccharide biosynthesis protein SpsF
MKPRVVVISQARMTSTRLPGKVLMEAAGKPLLAYHIERLRQARRIDAVVIATTVNTTDDPIVALADSLGVPVARGDEQDVLDRFVRAARMAKAEVVVRVTSDCPLIDPVLIDRLVDRYLAGRDETPPLDYAYIDVTRIPRGLDGEIFSAALLEEAGREAVDQAEREHVTPYIYRRPQRFRMEGVVPGGDAHPYRLCVDEPADLEVVRRVFEHFLPGHPGFGWQDCCKLLDDHPEWVTINEGVRQRTSH